MRIVKLLIENGADISKATFSKSEIEKALRMQWTFKDHYLYSKKTQSQIITTIKLAFKNCQMNRLPKDIIFIICGFIASRGILLRENIEEIEPRMKKQKIEEDTNK